MSDLLFKKYKGCNKVALGESLVTACRLNDLEAVRFLLTSPRLFKNANIHAQQDNALVESCRYGHLEIIKYLLTSPELTDHANIKGYRNSPIEAACLYGNLDVVKYLISSPELKKKVDIHAGNDVAFVTACNQEKMDIIEYFIFELDIERTNRIAAYLRKQKSDFTFAVTSMFNAKELNDKLQKDLNSAKIKQKKPKI